MHRRFEDTATSTIFETAFVNNARITKHGFIKFLPDNQLVSEFLCSKLGKRIGLPVADCFLGRVSAFGHPELTAKFPGKEFLYGFVTEQLPHHELTKFNRHIKENEILTWPGYDLTVAFDEWTANPDRHFQNMLYDPQNRDFYLIDFGHAFGGNVWVPSDLVVPKSYGNKLLQFGKSRLSKVESERLLAKARELQTFAVRIDYDSICDRLCGGLYADKALLRGAVSFLKQRIFRLTSLLVAGLYSQESLEFKTDEVI